MLYFISMKLQDTEYTDFLKYSAGWYCVDAFIRDVTQHEDVTPSYGLKNKCQFNSFSAFLFVFLFIDDPFIGTSLDCSSCQKQAPTHKQILQAANRKEQAAK